VFTVYVYVCVCVFYVYVMHAVTARDVRSDVCVYAYIGNLYVYTHPVKQLQETTELREGDGRAVGGKLGGNFKWVLPGQFSRLSIRR